MILIDTILNLLSNKFKIILGFHQKFIECRFIKIEKQGFDPCFSILK